MSVTHADARQHAPPRARNAPSLPQTRGAERPTPSLCATRCVDGSRRPFQIDQPSPTVEQFRVRPRQRRMATEVERAAFQGDRVVMRGRSFTESGRLLTMRHQFRPLRVDRNHSAAFWRRTSRTARRHTSSAWTSLTGTKRSGSGRVATALSTECVLLFEKDGRFRLERLWNHHHRFAPRSQRRRPAA